MTRSLDDAQGSWKSTLRTEIERIREPHRLTAIVLLALTGGLVIAFLVARGELAGSDARAYWAGTRIWLAGGDPWHPGAPFLPYVYAPWSIPLFLPWALLPWTVAWFLWRGLNVLLLLWSIEWAYRRRPLATAVAVALLGAPIAITLDTGNVTLFLALMIWATQFVGPRLGGALWAFATGLKWLPAMLIVFMPPRARLWGIVGLGLAFLLVLATAPQTLIQIQTALNFPRPLRIDYTLYLWGAIPWLWSHPESVVWLGRRELPQVARRAVGRISGSLRHLGTDGDRAAAAARRGFEARVRAFFGVGGAG